MDVAIKRSRVGPADLLEAWQSSKGEVEFNEAAELLGFAYRQRQSLDESIALPENQASLPKAAAGSELQDIELPASSAQDRPAAPFFAVTRHRQHGSDQQLVSLPKWVNDLPALESDDIWDSTAQAVEWPNLTRKPRLQAVLRRQLKRDYNSAVPDTEKLIERISRGLSLRELPMQLISRRVHKLHVLVDESRHLRTMLPDAIKLVHTLRQQWGNKQLSLQGTLSDPAWPVRQRDLKAGVRWLIVSDLGLLSTAAARSEWQRLLRLLSNSNIECLILSPVSNKRLRSHYLAGMPSYSWDQGLRPVVGQHSSQIDTRLNEGEQPSAYKQAARLEEQGPVQRLLAAISICYRVEQALLRALRVYLGLSVDAEAQCRRHADVADDGVYVQLEQAAQDQHRAVFKSQFTSAEQQAIVKIVTRHHAHEVQSILDQELDIAATLCGETLSRETIAHADTAKQRLRRLSITLHKNPDQHLLRCWSKTQLDLQAGEDRQRAAHFFAGLHLDALNSDESSKLDLPKGMRYADLLPYIDGHQQLYEIELKQSGEGLYLQVEKGRDSARIRQADPRGQFILDHCSVRGDRLLINGELLPLKSEKAELNISLQPFSLPITIETGLENLQIDQLDLASLGGVEAVSRTRQGVWISPDQKKLPAQYRCEQLLFPSWASSVVQDEFGIYAELEIAIEDQSESFIKQGFRWIPPGEFMMGSPKSEAGRYDNEDHHLVMLNQGFWLADTACSQAVWQAVMGDNPSHFILSDQHPVEHVSWLNVQKFTQQLNKQIPDIQAGMPSEAQWEYACRAASGTVFNFGDSLHSDQVNFDGTESYKGAPKGEFREKTIEVNKFKQNDWGLYQMHGNVLEWCQD